jgi:serine/threonine-protein kinase
VYALGVILHELLTGRRPYAATGDSAAALAVAQSRGEAPVMSQSTSAASPLPARRLRGDLDLIVATALRHDPAQRYPGADALAEDLRRHLAGWPLRAQRDSATHRLRKFVTRHRVALPLATIAVVALVATTAFALMQARDARQQAARAEAVRNFLLDLFEQADPDRDGDKPLTARDLIDLGAQRVRRGLVGDPDTRIDLLGVVGNLYGSLGQAGAAIDVRQDRLRDAEQRYAADDARIALARIDLAQSEGDREHFDRARELIHAALQTLPGADLAGARLRANALDVLGWIETHSGRYDEATKIQHERIALLRKFGAAAAPALASALNDLGALQHLQGNYGASAQNYREALSIIEAQSDAKPSALIRIRYDLALDEHEQAHFEQADVLFKRNLDYARKIYGENHRSVADQLYQIGQNARQSGRVEDSLPWLQQALATYERVDGPTHSRVATALTTLAQAQMKTGAKDEAIANLERAYRIYLDTLGPKHLFTAVGETALAQAKLEAGDALGAEAAFRDALAKYAAANPDHIYADAVRKGLGEALTAQRRYAEAESMLRLAHEHVSAKYGIADYRSEGTAIALAQCLHGAGRTSEASTLLAGTRKALESTPDTPTRTRNLDKLKAAEDALKKS